MLDCAAEKRYRRILLSGVELNKDFYFSYTYNLGQTLQASLTAEQPRDCFESRFVWNEYLSRSGAMTYLAARPAAAAMSGVALPGQQGTIPGLLPAHQHGPRGGTVHLARLSLTGC